MSATPGVAILTPEQLHDLVADAVAEALAGLTERAPEPDLVPPAEMARRLGISRTSLHRLRVAGAPVVRVGDVHRYRPADVISWLQSRDSQKQEKNP